MPPRKKIAKRSGGRPRPVSEDQKVPQIPTDATIPPSFDVFAYPHILSLIIDESSLSTLSTLLRCSKSMFKAVAPSMYENLRVTSTQLKALIERGWMAPKAGSAGRPRFSSTLTQCLQITRTLHWLDYDSGLVYANPPQAPPRGCFAQLTRVVLYVARPNDMYDFPPIFNSLGTDLYIRLTGRGIIDHAISSYPLVLFGSLPRSFNSLTFLVPLAYRYAALPAIFAFPSERQIGKKYSVVLLPWVSPWDDQTFNSSTFERWSNFDDSPEYGPSIPATLKPGTLGQLQIAGAEFTGSTEPGRLKLLHSYQLPASPEFISFINWLDTIPLGTVFSPQETSQLRVKNYELQGAIDEAKIVKLDARIAAHISSGEDHGLQANNRELRANLIERRNIFSHLAVLSRRLLANTEPDRTP